MKIPSKTPKTDWNWFPKKKKTPKPKAKAIKFTPTELSPQGHSFDVSWPGVAGAKKVLVDEAELRFMPATFTRNLGELDTKSTQSGKAIDIDLKVDEVLRYVKFVDLKSDDVTLRHSGDLSSNSWKLLCSAKLDGAWVPLYAVPKLGKRGAVPAMLGGASLNHRLLSLPGKVSARHWRIEIVEGSAIEDLSPRAVDLKKATGKVRQPPEDPKVLGPDGGELWSQTGVWQAAEARVSLRVPLEHALQDQLDQSASPLAVSYSMTGAEHSRVNVLNSQVKGILLREHAGVWEHKVEGEAALLGFDPELASETPTSVGADLSVNYLGIRLLDLPAPTSLAEVAGKTSGCIITPSTTVVDLPKQLFGPPDAALPPARLGIRGRAVESCELVVKFTDRTTGRVIGDPAALEIPEDQHFQFHWFQFPEKPFQATTPQLEITATRGRFYWVGGDLNSLKFAVYDPDPGNRPLLLNGAELTRVAEVKSHKQAQALPTPAFQGGSPKLSSQLFLKVELTDLQLRYAR